MNAPSLTRRSGQRGVALLIGLVLLIVLTIVALVAMQLVSNQSRVAANAWGEQMSLATGEGALGNAESQLLSGALNFASGTDGQYIFNPATAPQWSDPAFNWNVAANVLAGAGFANSQYPKSSAKAIVEQLPAVAGPGQSMCVGYNCSGGTVQVFRVTVNSVGPDGKLPAIVQDTSVQ
jgi:type IV pilus assembly protein PilX